MASAMDRFKVSKSGGDRSRLIAEGEVEEVQLGDQPHRYDHVNVKYQFSIKTFYSVVTCQVKEDLMISFIGEPLAMVQRASIYQVRLCNLIKALNLLSTYKR